MNSDDHDFVNMYLQRVKQLRQQLQEKDKIIAQLEAKVGQLEAIRRRDEKKVEDCENFVRFVIKGARKNAPEIFREESEKVDHEISEEHSLEDY